VSKECDHWFAKEFLSDPVAMTALWSVAMFVLWRLWLLFLKVATKSIVFYGIFSEHSYKASFDGDPRLPFFLLLIRNYMQQGDYSYSVSMPNYKNVENFPENPVVETGTKLKGDFVFKVCVPAISSLFSLRFTMTPDGNLLVRFPFWCNGRLHKLYTDNAFVQEEIRKYFLPVERKMDRFRDATARYIYEISTPANTYSGPKVAVIRRVVHINDEAIIMPKDMLEEIREDIRRAMEGEALCRAIGRRCKYSLMLYGPPGSGKSTLVEKLASDFSMNIVTIEIRHINLPHLTELRNKFGEEWVIVLVEDVHTQSSMTSVKKGNHDNNNKEEDPEATRRRMEEEYDAYVDCMSEILQNMDGLKSPNKIIFMFSCNKEWVRQPPEAFFRAGRIDKFYHIPYATVERVQPFIETVAKTPEDATSIVATLNETSPEHVDVALLKAVICQCGPKATAKEFEKRWSAATKNRDVFFDFASFKK
jgi:hypothetical protein